MVIITLKTILNEKEGYHFGEVILLFWLRQKMVQYTKYIIENRVGSMTSLQFNYNYNYTYAFKFVNYITITIILC